MFAKRGRPFASADPVVRDQGLENTKVPSDY